MRLTTGCGESGAGGRFFRPIGATGGKAGATSEFGDFGAEGAEFGEDFGFLLFDFVVGLAEGERRVEAGERAEEADADQRDWPER